MFFILPAFLYCSNTHGQTAQAAFKPLTVPTPEAASLMKPVEVPVGYFNGIPNISIPLHEIADKGISIPITLSYHSNGLKVTEESSWVGHSWSLDAGGMITQMPMGAHDGSSQACADSEHGVYIPNLAGSNYQNLGNLNTDASTLYNPSTGTQYTFQYLEEQNWWRMDGASDLYMYNFGGYSGKFIKSGGIYYELTNNKIKFTRTGNTFFAVTPDGYKYTFAVTEMSRPPSVNDGALPEDCVDYTIGVYYLTKIESPYNTTDKVEFVYKSFSELYSPVSTYFEPYNSGQAAFQPAVDGCVPQMPNYSSYYEYSQFVQGEVRSLGTTFVFPYYLSRITFSTGYIDFDLSARGDSYGFKLDGIRIYQTGQANPVKKFKFNYDYFTSATGFGTDYMTLPYTIPPGSNLPGVFMIDYPKNYLRKRLKLLSVVEQTAADVDGKKYQFEYQDAGFPYKSSLSQDYWGYYNGKPNITTLVPDFRRYLHRLAVPPYAFRNWTGANREPDETSMKAGILTKIIYPTKGWTQFDYEINRYTNLTEQQGLKFVTRVVHAQDVNRVDTDLFNGAYRAGVAQKEFTIAKNNTVVDISVNLFCNCTSNSCNCSAGQISYDCSLGATATSLYVTIQKWDPSTSQWNTDEHWDNWRPELRNCPQGGGGTAQYTRIFSTGLYRAVANLPDSKPGAPQYLGYPGDKWASIYITYSETVPNNNPSNEGGGLRVSRVANYDPETAKTTERTFTYEGGIMMRFPMFYSRSIIRKWDQHAPNLTRDDTYDYLRSNTVIPYSYSANGSLLGYTKVTETFPGNGRVVYRYQVQQDKLNYAVQNNYTDLKSLPGVPSTAYPGNGLEILVSYYLEGQVNPTKTVRTAYSEPLALKTLWNFEKEVIFPEAHTAPGWCTLLLCHDDIVTNVRLCFYPIEVGKVVPIKTIETLYTNNGPMITEAEFKYDNLDHLQLTRQIKKQSDGIRTITRYLYPGDYTNTTGFIGEMKTANMIAKPVETVSYQIDKAGSVNILGGKLTTYKTGSLVGLPDKEWYLETNAPVPLSGFRFSNQNAVNVLPEAGTAIAFTISNKDSRYPAGEKYLYDFDASGNLNQITSSGNVYASYLWNYSRSKPVAIINNALVKDAFYTSFEDTGVDDAQAKSGDKVYTTSTYSNPLASLTPGAYVLSYWKRTGSLWALTSTPVTVPSGGTYTISITGISATTPIDEVRFTPANAQLTTYTYKPVVGVTSATDTNGFTQYYEYDELARLKVVRDTNRKIVKHFQYHYKN